MARMPRDARPDATLALARDPYGYIANQCRALKTDVFRTRILLRETVCMMGRDAAELFCDEDRFQRRGAAPGRFRRTLFGTGGVQGLDGEAHRHRKQLFTAVMDAARVADLVARTEHWWRAKARDWAAKDEIVLYDEMHEVLTRAVCEWAGVPLAAEEVDRRTRDLVLLFDGAGAVGAKHWRARLARRRAERWAAEVIEQVRAGQIRPADDEIVSIIAAHRDEHGELLPVRIAAVELLNVLRPTVAVSVFITFTATALHEYPAWRERIGFDEADYAEPFAWEVRRFYPFFPVVTAMVRRDFDWRGYRFRAGTRAILDLYGTNHDARLWDQPDRFRPERFQQRCPDAYAFIPQGGGEAERHHRCPGEPIADALITLAARMLIRELAYETPEQDLRLDRRRLPALPHSGFRMRRVEPAS